MADPDRDYRVGRKLPRHYYQPAERIELVPGVTRKELNDWADQYAGSAEDLERAGVLRADMLPAPGRVQITWRPIGAARSYGHLPGYLEIRRHHDGTYRAKLAVSDAERERRNPGAQQRAREWQQLWRERRAQLNAETETPADQDRRRAEADGCPATASAFRELWLRSVMTILDSIKRPIVPERGGYSFRLDEEDLEELDDAFERVLDVFRTAAIGVDRAKVQELDALRAHAKARKDAPLQQFLSRVKAKARRG